MHKLFLFLIFLVYGTYPLNPPPKLHPPLSSHYHHKMVPGGSSDSRRLQDSELPIQKLASLTVSHKSKEHNTCGVLQVQVSFLL